MESTRNKLIQLLADNEDKYISGQLLSEKLNVSRSAIWKHMKELEKEWFQIEGKSRVGYRILTYPKNMSENTLQWGLNTDWLGKQIIHKETIHSTQILAHELAQNGASHGTIVIADEQTKGKGRMDRAFDSAKGKGIWLSMILKPTILPYLAPQLTLLTATILADVLKEQTTIQPQIKWPNDILIEGKKIAGILTEMQAEQDQILYVVIGIGININQTTNDFPDNIQNKVTSLQIESNENWSITEVTQAILQAFERGYESYIESGFPNVKNKWESYGYKIGKSISVKTLKDQFKATFLGIAEDGALLTETESGEIKRLYSAEIDWFKETNEK